MTPRRRDDPIDRRSELIRNQQSPTRGALAAGVVRIGKATQPMQAARTQFASGCERPARRAILRAMHEQNMAILKGLVAVAWADGHVADEELEVIEALLQAFNATPSEAVEVRKFAQSSKKLSDIPITDLSADDRRVLLQHAVLLTYIDGEQHAKEKKLLDELCDVLRIPGVEASGLIGAAEERAKRFLNLL